jgi:hypothetical protein
MTASALDASRSGLVSSVEDPADDPALGLFRKAIAEQDDDAWRTMVEQYRGLVLATIHRHSASASVLEDDAYWINRTFERLWVAVGSERIGLFKDVGSIVGYLKLCAVSVLMDAARARRRVVLLCDVEDRVFDIAISTDHADDVVADVDAAALWDTVRAILTDEKEQLIAQLSLRFGMAPREIYARYGDRFASIHDVYRGKRNLLERLRKAPELQCYGSTCVRRPTGRSLPG